MKHTKSYILGTIDILTFIKKLHKRERLYTKALDVAIDLLAQEVEKTNEKK